MESTTRRLPPPISRGFLDKLIPLSPWLDPELAKRGERHNAYARLFWSSVICGYVIYATKLRPGYLGLYAGIAFALLFCFAYLWSVFLWPAPSRGRRAAALLYDNLACNYIAFFGGPFAPVAWFLMWTTVAFGVRFGPSYVPRAAAVAIAGLVCNLFFSAYWQTHRAIGLSIIVVLVGVSVTGWLAFKDSAAAHVRAESRAREDTLTGLPNRHSFSEQLSQALSRAHRAAYAVAVLFFDLDGFKPVNDSLGHHAGDALLQEIAARVGRSLRRGDILGRLGGDEFAILLEPVGERVDAEVVAEKLVRIVAGIDRIAEGPVAVGASVGVVLVEPGQARSASPEQLMRRADDAMYQAKHAGKGRYRFAD